MPKGRCGAGRTGESQGGRYPPGRCLQGPRRGARYPLAAPDFI